MSRLEALAALDVDTPALVLDLAALEANIEAMAAFARRNGVALRPHAKTHKCAEIGRRQLAAGAVGLCVAKLGEAEALAAAGLGPLLVTSPIVGRRKLARLAALAAATPDLMVVVDDAAASDALAAAVAGRERPLDVLVDLDPGMARTGVADLEAALALARRIAATPALRFRGVQAYAGQIQHVNDAAARAQAARDVRAWLQASAAALGEAGLRCEIVTGSGTGTFAADAASGIFTDLQVGSYVFVDDEYAANAPTADAAPAFIRSAFVLAQVVSANHPGLATIDAGSKVLSFDGPLPSVQWPQGLAYRRAGDEFGKVAGDTVPAPGARVLLGLPHCDPTINFHDRFVVARDRAVVDTWPVTARGRAD